MSKPDDTSNDPERATQAAKRQKLLNSIWHARERNDDYTLRGCKAIALYVEKDERLWRRVNREVKEGGLPIYRVRGMIRMRVSTYERWLAWQEYARVRGIDLQRCAKLFGFEPPAPQPSSSVATPDDPKPDDSSDR